LHVLIQSAEWLSKGQRTENTSTNKSLAANTEEQSEELSPALSAVALAKEEKQVATKEIKVESHGEDYVFNLGDRQYRVRGLHKNGSFEVMKVNLRLWADGLFFVNVLDLYHAKQRNAFIAEAAIEARLKPELVKRDLGKILLKLEELQEQRINEKMQPKDETITVAQAEQKEALSFLQAPDLINRLLSDFDKSGIVGENANKVTAWLACVSRKLNKPLAVIIQSTSAAGKSTLMEAVLSFFPEEEQVKYSAMTGQSLYYLGESNLKHRILAIVEEEGAERASYALKLLQSEGELTIASTGKDPDTGRMKTEEYHVEGPVMIFLTTTAIDIDEELMNRCLVLTVDEGQEQTQRIHERQRMARTLEGFIASEERSAILKRQRNAQRLLKSYRIVNDFAKDLTFVSTRTRARRDHEKYLTLIDAVTLTHQHQRRIERQRVGDRIIEFIRTTLADIEMANRLAPEVLGRSLDELPPQTRRLLGLLKVMVKGELEQKKMEQVDYRFSRRQVREFTGWSSTQVKLHLDRLQELEYIALWHGRMGRAFEYELLANVNEPNEKHMIGLLDVEKLKKKYGYDADLSGSEGEVSGCKGQLSEGIGN